jgi:chemotaxis protein CheC
MRVNLAALESFSRMGDEGGERATEALETLTGVAAHLKLTRTTLVDREGLTTFLGEADTRFAVDFDGALSGRALVSYDDAFADHAADQFPVSGDVLQEISNILTSGFVDIWAECADSTIDIEPPEEITNGEDLVQDSAVVDDCAFVFESSVSATDVDGDCRFAVLPDVDPFLAYLADRENGDGAALAAPDRPRDAASPESDTVEPADAASPDTDSVESADSRQEPSVAALSSYIRLTAASADAVATHLASMVGVDADAVESHLDFVPVERVPSLLDDTAYEGAVFESEGVVDSVIAVLFEPGDADDVVAEMLPRSDQDPDPELAESAVAELGNVTASGFFDQWANSLETTIDISTPAHVHDEGRAVLDTVAAASGRHADTISVVDTTVNLGDELTCRVVAFPSPEDAETVAEIATQFGQTEGEQE